MEAPGESLEFATNVVQSWANMKPMGPQATLLAALVAVIAAASGLAAPAVATPAPAHPSAAAPAPAVVAERQPIRLDVAEIQVIGAYAPPRERPHVEHLFPTPPQMATVRWGESQLVAEGRANKATLIVNEASVVEVRLPTEGGIASLFKKELTERYDGVIAVELEIRDDFDNLGGRASARVTRSQSVLENISEAERKAIWSEMTEAMIADLERELRNRIKSNLTRFAR